MENQQLTSSYRDLILGVCLSLLGMGFLLESLEAAHLGAISKSAPLLVVAVGLSKIMGASDSRERAKGIWECFLGVWMLLASLKVWGLGFQQAWPLLLVGWGCVESWQYWREGRQKTLTLEDSNEK